MLEQKTKVWADELEQKLAAKFSAECDRIKDGIPYIAENGKYSDYAKTRPDWWTNGFWPGILWLMYEKEKEEKYARTARKVEDKLAENLKGFKANDHDYGFRYLISCVADYRLTGEETAKERGLFAAQMLAGRFNPAGGFIRAWDHPERVTWMIVDCLMNLPLLYWASDVTKDPRFQEIAIRHAQTSLRAILRPDGSSNHVAIFDPSTWEAVEFPGGQGYESGSSWSRGQAWAVYGFALSYHYTGKKEFLEGAKRAAHYFLANTCTTGFVPLVDFRAPKEPVMYDTTAGPIAACGMLMIAKHTAPNEQEMYWDGAVRLLQAAEQFCDFDPETDSILQKGTVMYTKEIHVPIIYGDFFLLEAVRKLQGSGFQIW